MMYEVTITDAATYVINDAESEAEAVMRALDWFNERMPTVNVQKVRPCQVQGECPYDPQTHTCSDCRKEFG